MCVQSFMAKMDCNKLRNTNNTEPKVEVDIARSVVVTVGNATVGSTVEPATAPTHAAGPR